MPGTLASQAAIATPLGKVSDKALWSEQTTMTTARTVRRVKDSMERAYERTESPSKRFAG